MGESDFEASLPAGSRSDPATCGHAPGRAPAGFDQADADDRHQHHTGEEEETRGIAVEGAFGPAEGLDEGGTAQAAGAADDAGHDAHVLAETLGNQLEDGAVGHAEVGHDEKEYQDGQRSRVPAWR